MKKIFTLFAALLVTTVMFAQKTYTVYWEDGLEQANAVTNSDGIKIQITGNETKNLSGGNAITMPSGDALKAIKVSNGAESTITMPEGEYAGKVTFYSYVNKTADDIAGARTSYWKEVNGVAYDETTAKIMTCPNNKPVETPDVNTYELGGVSSFTFTNIGEQVVYVAVIETSEKGSGGTVAPESPLYTAVGKSAKFPADWEGWNPATCMLPGIDVKVEVYNGYVIIRNWMGVEGYDCCFIVPEGENLEDVSPTESYAIINGVEQEPSVASGYSYIATGRTDYPTAAQYLAYTTIGSEKESEEGYAIICQYLYDANNNSPEQYYYFISWPPLADEPNVVPGEAESWSVANLDAEAVKFAEYVDCSTENVKFTYRSSPNEDVIEKGESYNDVKGAEGANTSLIAEGYPQWDKYIMGKGNPELVHNAYKEWSDDKSEEIWKFEGATFWEPGCGALPIRGQYMEIEAAQDGTILIGIYKNKNANPLYIIDESDFTFLPGSALTLNGYLQNNGFEVADINGDEVKECFVPFTIDDDAVIDRYGQNRPLLGYLQFSVAAGKKYMLIDPKSQVGLYGFEFTPDGSSSIAAVEVARPANNIIYNLAGQRVGADYKGIVIKNGKKYMVK